MPSSHVLFCSRPLECSRPVFLPLPPVVLEAFAFLVSKPVEDMRLGAPRSTSVEEARVWFSDYELCWRNASKNRMVLAMSRKRLGTLTARPLLRKCARGTQNGSPVKKLRDKHLEDSKYDSLSKTFIHNVNDATSVGNAFWDTQNWLSSRALNTDGVPVRAQTLCGASCVSNNETLRLSISWQQRKVLRPPMKKQHDNYLQKLTDAIKQSSTTAINIKQQFSS